MDVLKGLLKVDEKSDGGKEPRRFATVQRSEARALILPATSRQHGEQQKPREDGYQLIFRCPTNASLFNSMALVPLFPSYRLALPRHRSCRQRQS